MNLRDPRTALSLVFAIACLLIVSCITREPLSELPAEFYTYDGDQRDPLIIRGDAAVPVVIQRIRETNMPRRRAAIRYLGNGRYESALPVLRELYSDITDPDRDVLLEEIFRIDQAEGTRLARLSKDENGDLGKAARYIMVREPFLFQRRSRLEAWLAYQGLEPRE